MIYEWSVNDSYLVLIWHPIWRRDCCGRYRMVVLFTTTYAIGGFHHKCCEFESRSQWGVLDTTLFDQVCQWLVTCCTNKTDLHDITEILLKLLLNTLTLTPIWRPCNMIFVWLKCEKLSLNWTITFLKWSMYQNISLFRFGQTTSIAAMENYFR